MIKAFKKLVPTYVKYLYRAIPDYYYDLKRFYKYASNQGVKDSEEKYIGHIVKRYHVKRAHHALTTIGFWERGRFRSYQSL